MEQSGGPEIKVKADFAGFSPATAWAWITQRITAVLLLVLLGLHMWVGHFADPAAGITFLGVTAKLKTVLYVIVDWSLLVTGLYHALNGFRNILLDWGMTPAGARTVSAVLWVIGAVYLIYGVWVLRAFLTA